METMYGLPSMEKLLAKINETKQKRPQSWQSSTLLCKNNNNNIYIIFYDSELNNTVFSPICSMFSLSGAILQLEFFLF